jgi:hypothetical protein
MSFTTLKHLSFTHSAIYTALLVSWALSLDTIKPIFGWAHGVGWICMSLLCLVAVRRRVIPMWLAVMVIIVGGVGPFAGSIAFVLCERRHEQQESALRRGMV